VSRHTLVRLRGGIAAVTDTAAGYNVERRNDNASHFKRWTMRILPALIPARTLGLLLSEIFWLFSSFILTYYVVLPGDPAVVLLYDNGLVSIGLVVASILLGFYLLDLYTDIRVKSKIVLVQQLCFAAGMSFLFMGLISYVLKIRMPIIIMAVGNLLSMTVIFAWRVLYTAYVLRVVGGERLLLVGGSGILLDIARYIEEHPQAGCTVAGYVDDVHEMDSELPGGKVLGPMATLREVVKATRPSRVVVGMFERRNRMPVNELLELRFAGHVIEEAASAYERVCGRVCIKELRPSQLIYTGKLGPRRQTLLYHNLMNVLVAAIGILVSSPIMLLTALAVKLTSRGPVLYRQRRVGLDDVPFTVLKFRSMRMDAETGTGAVWAAKDDPRVTPVGGFIRRRRFDELPQLFNVLWGEMSIVGPRPERPEFVKALSEQIPYYRQRHCVRPGITGWAQINYKYGDTLEDTITKLEYDLFYIKNMSFSLDTYIMFHSLKAMMFSDKAQ
jgi:sugar transferase (PEP-CTERM system associated)